MTTGPDIVDGRPRPRAVRRSWRTRTATTRAFDRQPSPAARNRGGNRRRAGSRAASRAITALTTIGSPIAVATPLLVYFGWVRMDIQAQQLGYDSSVMDMSTQDYVIRSVGVLYVPLILTVLFALVLYWAHIRVVTPTVAGTQDRERLGRWIRIFAFSWVLWTPVCVLLLLSGPPLAGFALPGLLTGTLLCAIYAGLLRRRVHRNHRTPTALKVLVAVLLTLAVFWDTERVARTMGEAYAADIIAAPERLPAVVVYSSDDLGIDTVHVRKDTVARAGALPLHTYRDLRLLHRSGSRYLLITQTHERASTRVFVITETPTVRIEFSETAQP
jgi:hypothetical protein